ncbi:endoplasmic reticulum-based factor for assembly of V-ATPase-domain-containing protein [Lasiosphaeria ovina]|uniref:Endoplasmic reticulum-based factor for assembly of V-ATPase-domain-containing protein n=1 Tax=Lasiosphaeria ovina TaxID=92902 RepID=A0AAE0KHP4_9PEZI|nr:endoplasmic reticulum-based factor for assembly of V-ATPase-domain-containing protein [Lasiosphaeria ovina]
MTSSIVEGLSVWSQLAPPHKEKLLQRENEPSLDGPSIGNPISHSQIIDLWASLRDAGSNEYRLERLLNGAKVYDPPPPPKPEPSNEYKALMVRLRRDEEQRIYGRMMNTASPLESFSQRGSGGAGMMHAFAEVNRPGQEADVGDDDVTFNDVHRQLMLMLNFVVSILGVAATLWILARWWSTPARLFLTMGGSILVGIAEVVVYSGYIWNLGEAKKKDKTLREVKEVVQTWVVGTEKDGESEFAIAKEKVPSEESNLRRRKERNHVHD